MEVIIIIIMICIIRAGELSFIIICIFSVVCENVAMKADLLFKL